MTDPGPLEPTAGSGSDLARRPTHIVGIGASAGGLEALERFFAKMPARTGLAFVVLQHLSPDFKSLTDELLARRTPIPIHQAGDGLVVERDAIYLLPPRKDMIIADGRLLLTDKDPSQGMTLPIDHFFRSLAQDAGDRAIGVILSGTGSDGSRGLRDIHDAGGLVLVQSAETAKFDGMPKSALNTGVVDAALAPEEMYAALLKYVRHPLTAELPPEAVPVPLTGMDAVLRQLRDSYDLDFAHYKPATVARRTERRMLLTGTAELPAYVRLLAENPEERNALYRDLLIGVTRFFRDPEAFAALGQGVLPELLQQVPRQGEFRAWVAGCATGEEAYSLAILIQEQIDALRRPVAVRVFATDAHRASLEVAGAGVYDEAALGEISPARLERFFVPKAGRYHVSPELRKLVVFAQHNVLKDAPFTKLDLVTCRNLLIYFQPLAQRKVLSLFHFGLRAGGALFLGPSESPGELADEFDTADARWRIYRKRRDVRLPTEINLGPTGPPRVRRPGEAVPLPAGDHQLLGTYDVLLDEYLPPSLLVNDDRQLLQTFAGAGRYLRHRDGVFTNDVLDMVEPELRMALTGALPRALKEQQPVAYKGLRVTLDGGERLVDLTVKPIRNRRNHSAQALVCLAEVGPAPARPEAPEEMDLGRTSSDRLQSLEAELRYTKENLQATIEELETSNEELQATNEELVASNEELQSTNEELHSVNEELYTVNAEYQKKIQELTVLTADLDNLLTSTDLHLIFLDRALCVRKFTPPAAEIFHLLPQDVGRPLDSFTHLLDYPDLLADVRQVLATARRREREVGDRRGRVFLLRLLPYRTPGGVEGVVLTLVDLTTLKAAQAAALRKEQQLTGILRHSPHPLFIMDLQGRYTLADDTFRELVGRDPVGLMPHDLFPAAYADAILAHLNRVLQEGRSVAVEITLPLAEGPRTFLSVKFPLRDEGGRITTVGGLKTDVTALKVAERQALELVRQREQFLAMLSHELRNPLAAILGAAPLLDRAGLAGPAADAARGIDRRARHMARLLDDLLDVSRMTQNRIEIRRAVIDLGALVADVAAETKPWFPERGPALTVEPPAGPLPVEGDPHRLQQIQVNLLLNAAKYTPATGRVWYALRREGDEAVIRVRDTGAGIPATMLEKVFDPFVQLDNTRDRAGRGIGVGLTLVRTLVELHGGRVRAYSDGPGKGSEFVVWLPLARQPVPPPAPPQPRPDAPAPSAIKVLIVEDDEDIRNVTEALLTMDGYPVRTAGDVDSGLAAARAFRPAVALIDIGLPGTDGYELARRLRAEPGPPPLLVAVTGYGQPQDREAARRAGFDHHLTKPVSDRDLRRLLELAARRV